MNQPAYLRPVRLSDALQVLSEWGELAQLLAGGTDLLVWMQQGTLKSQAVIDITALSELRGVSYQNGYVVVGALTTHSEIAQNEELARWASVLVSACREIGSVQIRNRGTLGGNVGTASPAGDTLPALYVLDASIHLLSSESERWVPVAEFFTGPGQTSCRPNEMIAGVRFRPSDVGEKGFFCKIGQRRAVRVAKASAAGALLLEGDVVSRCRLALGAVAPGVMRVAGAEEYLVGRQLTLETVKEAARLTAGACQPITDIRSTAEYRRYIAGVLVSRGLKAIVEEVGG